MTASAAGAKLATRDRGRLIVIANRSGLVPSAAVRP